jgi:hypothetical protein
VRSGEGGDRGRGRHDREETVERAIDYSKFERRPAKSGGSRTKPSRSRRDTQDEPEAYSYQDPVEETFTGDATLEDLVSKFNAGKSRRSNRRDDAEDEKDGGDNRNRRNVIDRTLAMRDDE